MDVAFLAPDRSSTQFWTPAEVIAQLVQAGTDPERSHAVSQGDAFSVAGFAVQVLIDQVTLHPGNSFTPAPAGTDLELLVLPVAAP